MSCSGRSVGSPFFGEAMRPRYCVVHGEDRSAPSFARNMRGESTGRGCTRLVGGTRGNPRRSPQCGVKRTPQRLSRRAGSPEGRRMLAAACPIRWLGAARLRSQRTRWPRRLFERGPCRTSSIPECRQGGRRRSRRTQGPACSEGVGLTYIPGICAASDLLYRATIPSAASRISRRSPRVRRDAWRRLLCDGHPQPSPGAYPERTAETTQEEHRCHDSGR
jgi:hypothetical protein